MVFMVVVGILVAFSWGLGFGAALRTDRGSLRHVGQRKRFVRGVEEWLRGEAGDGNWSDLW